MANPRNRQADPPVQTPPAQTVETNGTPAVPVVNEFNLQDEKGVLQSKRYVKGALVMLAPSELLAPVLPVLRETNGTLILTGDTETKNANADNSENVAFGRINLVARYEIDAEIFYEIGILAAFDLGQPKLKVYRGAKTAACLNLNVWGQDDLVKFDISQGINIEVVTNFVKSITEQIQKSKQIVDAMKAQQLNQQQVEQIIGKMLLRTISEKSVNGSTAINRAVDLITNDKSKYYMKQPNFNLWTLHNALTEHFAEKVNFFDIPEKTRESYRLLQEINPPASSN